jgi:hypothetical protein
VFDFERLDELLSSLRLVFHRFPSGDPRTAGG